jgi:hypothetical protein
MPLESLERQLSKSVNGQLKNLSCVLSLRLHKITHCTP